MPQVICSLPNASEEISGVKFSPTEDGEMLSEEVSDEVAEQFLAIPHGYRLAGDVKGPLLERAAAVGLKVDNRWSDARLEKEVLEAEAKKSASAKAE